MVDLKFGPFNRATKERRHPGHGYVKIFAQVTWVKSLPGNCLLCRATRGTCRSKMTNSCKISTTPGKERPRDNKASQTDIAAWRCKWISIGWDGQLGTVKQWTSFEPINKTNSHQMLSCKEKLKIMFLDRACPAISEKAMQHICFCVFELPLRFI